MDITILKTMDELKGVEAGWLRLLEHPCNNRLCHDFDWFRLSIEAFHPDDQLYVLVLNDENGNLMAVAPLIITWGVYRGLKVKKVGFAQNEQSPENDFVLSPGLEEDCLRTILDHLCTFADWEFVELSTINIEGRTGVFFKRYLEEKKLRFGTRWSRQSPYITIDTNWENFWKSRPKNFRKAMRRNLNRAKKLGGMEIEKRQVCSANVFELKEMLRISKSSWKRHIGTDLGTRKDNWTFYNKLAETYGPKGLIVIWLFTTEGVPVAFEFQIEYKKVFYTIRADFDEAFRELSPGSILMYEVMQIMFSHGAFKEYDSCGHTYEYLLRWSDKVRDYWVFEIFNKNAKMSFLYHLEYVILERIRKTLMYRFYKGMAQSKNSCRN